MYFSRLFTHVSKYTVFQYHLADNTANCSVMLFYLILHRFIQNQSEPSEFLMKRTLKIDTQLFKSTLYIKRCGFDIFGQNGASIK